MATVLVQGPSGDPCQHLGPLAEPPTHYLTTSLMAPFSTGTGSWEPSTRASLSLITSFCFHSLLFMEIEAGFQGRK